MTQIQLSNAQTIILSTACARQDGAVFPVTTSLKGGAVGNVCKSLLKHGLIEEVKASDHNTVWRHDETLGSITLQATRQAHVVLGISDTPQTEELATDTESEPPHRRSGSKTDILIAMLRTESGATIDEIAEATSWQSHSIRGAISGILKKKLGLTVTSEKIEGRGRVYRTITHD